MARGRHSAADSAEKSIPALSNIGYFSDYYLAHRLDAGLADLYSRWDAAEKVGDPTARTRVRSLSSALNRHRADAANTAPDETARDTGRLDLGDLPRDAREALLALNDEILSALGWKPNRGEVVELVSGDKAVSVPVAHRCETPTGLLLLAIDTVFTTDPAAVVASKTAPTGRLVEPVLVNGKPAAYTALDAAQLVFTADDPPELPPVRVRRRDHAARPRPLGRGNLARRKPRRRARTARRQAKGRAGCHRRTLQRRRDQSWRRSPERPRRPARTCRDGVRRRVKGAASRDAAQRRDPRQRGRARRPLPAEGRLDEDRSARPHASEPALPVPHHRAALR